MKTLHFETLWTAGGLALMASYLFFLGVFFTIVRVNMLRRQLDKALEDQYPWREKKGRPWKFYIAMIILSLIGFFPYFPNIIVPIVFGLTAIVFIVWCMATWPPSDGVGGMQEHLFLPWLMVIVSFYATALNCELTSLLIYGPEWPAHVVSGFGIRIMIHSLSVLFGLSVLLLYSMKTKIEYDEGPIRLRHVVFCDQKKLIDKHVGERFPKSRKNKSQTN
jgi:hypothetical protein